MQSRCYYLLDSNGIPPRKLMKISRMIQRFVRGSNSCMPYSSLAPPMWLGGLNCPSLNLRAEAYDLKFISDLITDDQDVLWKQWTMKDLSLATIPSKVMPAETELNPLTQSAYVKVSRLEPRVRAAIKTGHKYGLFPLTLIPSPNTSLDLPIYKHPYLSSRATDGLWCMANNHDMTTIRHLPIPGTDIGGCDTCTKRNTTVQNRLKKIGWYQPLAANRELPQKPPCAKKPSILMDRFRLPYLTLPESEYRASTIPLTGYCWPNPPPETL
jgi:hypothetical protein